MKEFIKKQKESRDWKVLSHNQIKEFKKQIKTLEALKLIAGCPEHSKFIKKRIKKIRRTLEGIVYNWEFQDKKEKSKKL